MIINAPLIKNGLFVLAGLAVTIFAFAQRTEVNRGVIEQNRNVSDFDIIHIEDGVDLYITQGNRQSVTVKADEEYMDQVITKVEGNTLYIETQGRISNPEALDVYVTVPNLRELHASGGSDVYAEEGMKMESFTLDCSGGSDTRMKLEVGTLYCQTSGGSDADLSGEVQNLELESSGGSDFNGKNLRVVNARVRSSGASDAWIYATGEVDVEASGASDVHIKGDAKIVRAKASGGADVHY
jgi:hypothetical protein